MATITQLYLTIARGEIYKETGKKVTDYALAKRLGIGTGTISRYMNDDRECEDDEIIYRLAKLAQVNPFEIMGMIKARKAKSEEVKTMWENASKGMLAGVGALTLTGALLTAPGEVLAGNQFSNLTDKNIYYTNSLDENVSRSLKPVVSI